MDTINMKSMELARMLMDNAREYMELACLTEQEEAEIMARWCATIEQARRNARRERLGRSLVETAEEGLRR